MSSSPLFSNSAEAPPTDAQSAPAPSHPRRPGRPHHRYPVRKRDKAMQNDDKPAPRFFLDDSPPRTSGLPKGKSIACEKRQGHLDTPIYGQTFFPNPPLLKLG